MKLNAEQKQKFLDAFRYTYILRIKPGYNLMLVRLNEDYIHDFDENGFGDEIKNNYLYNNHVLIPTTANELPISKKDLPILESENKWKWFMNQHPEDAIFETILRDDLLSIDDFEEFLNS